VLLVLPRNSPGKEQYDINLVLLIRPQPGDIMKPSMYFYTEQKLKDLHINDLFKLFVGKISLKEINNIQKYNGLIPQEKLISFFNIK